jgi:hypothetical protein
MVIRPTPHILLVQQFIRIFSYAEELLAPRPTPRLEDHLF